MAEETDYARGVAAGQVLSRLDSHDKHFAKLNGSMERVADELARVFLVVQRLGDAADADRATVLVTADALEKAEKARRDKSETGWTPFQRWLTVIGVIAAIATVITYVIFHG
jgi:hypothetical protein